MKQLLTVLMLVLVLAACAGNGSTGEVTVPEDPDRVVLTVTSEGGFVPVEFNLDRMPRYVLMADRTLYFQGPTTLEFPGALLPNVQQTTLPEKAFDEVLSLIGELGLPEIDEEVDNQGAEQIADATTEFITFYDEAGTHRYGFYALDISDAGSTDRLLAIELVQALDQASANGPATPFHPDRLQVAAGPPMDFDGLGSTEPWPLSASFEEMDEWAFGWRCLELEGEDVDELLAVFESANQATVWDTGSETYTLKARPLLPGETACSGAPQGA
jgi:hypothetical protein